MKWYKVNGGIFSEDFEFFKTQMYSYWDKNVSKWHVGPTAFYHSFIHICDNVNLEETHLLLKNGEFGNVEVIEKDFEDFWQTTQTQVRFKNPEVQEKLNGVILTYIPHTGLGVGVEFWKPGDNYFSLAMTDKEYERYVEKCKLKGEKPEPNKGQKIKEYTKEEFDSNFEICSQYQINFITKKSRTKILI